MTKEKGIEDFSKEIEKDIKDFDKAINFLRKKQKTKINTMTRFLLSWIGFIIAFGLGILVLMLGWGLEPQSWGWIIFGGIASSIIGALFSSSK